MPVGNYQILVQAVVNQQQIQTQLTTMQGLTAKIATLTIDQNAITALQAQVTQALSNIQIGINPNINVNNQNPQNQLPPNNPNNPTNPQNNPGNPPTGLVMGTDFADASNQMEIYLTTLARIRAAFVGLGQVVDVSKVLNPVAGVIEAYNVTVANVVNGLKEVTKFQVAIDANGQHTLTAMKSAENDVAENALQVRRRAEEVLQLNERLAGMKIGKEVVFQDANVTAAANAVRNAILEFGAGTKPLQEVQTEFMKLDNIIKETSVELDQTILKLKERLRGLEIGKSAVFADPNVRAEKVNVQNAIAGLQAQTTTAKEVEVAFSRLQNAIKTTAVNLREVNAESKGWLGNFVGEMGIAIVRTVEWGLSMGILYGGLRKIKEAVQFIKDVNSEMSKIQVLQVTGAQSNSQIDSLSKTYNKLAIELGATTMEIAKGSVEWLRQGKTIQETQDLMRSTMMLSKLGALDSAQATEYLTSTLNGFQMQASEAEGVVDRLVALDNSYATSVSEIANALSRASAVASESGVSFDELASYITVVSSVTRRDAASIGEAFKTMFTRMENIKLNRLFDNEDTTNLNDVERALRLINVDLRDVVTGGFRPLSDVMSEIAVKWPAMGELEKAAIRVAIAGTRQVNTFTVLMQNWDKVVLAQKIAMNSAGLAANRYSIYLDSIEAKQAKFNATWEKLVMNTLSSDPMKQYIDATTGIVELIDKIGVLNIAIIVSTTLFSANFTAIMGGLGRLVYTLFIGTGVASAFWMAVAGMGVGLAIVGIIAALDAFNVTAQESYDSMLKSKVVAEDNRAELKKLSDEYLALASNQTKSEEQLKRILDIQAILVDKYGMSKDKINLYSAAISNNTTEIEKNVAAIEEQRKQEAERFLLLNKIAYEENKKYLSTPKKEASRATSAVDFPLIGLTPKQQTDYLANQIGAGKDTAGVLRIKYDAIQKEIELRQKLIDEVDLYKQYLIDIGILQSKNNSNPNGGVKDISLLRDNYIQASTAVGTLFGEATSMMAEVQKTGEVTLNQLAQLQKSYPKEYTLALNEENGKLKLNVEEFKKLVIEKAKLAVVNAQLAVDSAEHTDADHEALAIAQLMLKNLQSQVYWETAMVDAMKDKNAATEAEAAYNDLLKDTIDMLKQVKEAEKDALQEELNGYKKIIDARKQLIDLQQAELDYQDQIAEKSKEISDIQNELLELQFDNSEAGRAKRLKLEEDLAKKNKDLTKMQNDYSVNKQKDALDKEYNDFKDATDNKMRAIDLYLKQSGLITQEAIALLATRSDAFYQSLIEWNRKFGSGVDQDIISKWQQAIQWVEYYKLAVSSISTSLGSGGGGTGIGRTADGRGLIPVDAISRLLGYTYHDGGFVGGSPSISKSEEYAKLMKGEFVATPNMMSNFIDNTLPKLAGSKNGGDTFNIDKMVEIVVTGNLDKTIVPEIKEVVFKAINDIMKSRGMRRDSFSYSL